MKKSIVIATLVLLTLNCFPQAVNWQWARTGISSGGGLAYGEGYNIAVDSLENSYLTGYYENTLTFDTFALNSPNNQEAFLVKYNSAGNVQWGKSTVGPGSAYGMGMATDASENVYWVGTYFHNRISFDTVTLDSTNNHNIFLTKYNSAGNLLWVRSADYTASVYNNSVATDKFGNIYITGSFNSPTITFGTYTLTKIGQVDLFIVKYDSLGNVIWAKSEGGVVGGYLSGCIKSDPSGNVYITGYFSSPTMTIGTYSLTNNGTFNSFLAKYDSTGNVLWAKSAGGTYYESGIDISTNSSAYVYVAGILKSPSIIFGNDTLINVGTENIYLAKYDSIGNVIWAISSLDSGVCSVYHLATDNNGNPYISGGQSGAPNNHTIAFNNLSLTISSNYIDPMYIVKFDTAGNAISGAVFLTGGDDDNGIAISQNNNIYLGGDFAMNPFILGNDTLFLSGSESPFITKFTFNSTTVPVKEIKKNETISIYPNPFTSQTTIIFAEEQKNTTIKITNVLGEELKTINFTGRQLVIDKAEMKAGIYFVQTTDEQKRICNRKIIIQ